MSLGLDNVEDFRALYLIVYDFYYMLRSTDSMPPLVAVSASLIFFYVGLP